MAIDLSPRISVCMAVRNEERYLEEAVRSVLAQTRPDFELIIVDDGSTDGTSAILDRLVAEDARVRRIRQENRGLAPSLNVALSSARGELIARMDGDDFSEPERFAVQVAYLDAHPEVAAVGCQALWIDPEGLPLRRNEHPLDHASIEELLLRGRGGAIQHATCIFRRAALRAIGGYRPDVRFSEDLDLFLRLSEHAKLANVPETLYRYRQHTRSICHADRTPMKSDHDRILAEAWARRGMPQPEDHGNFRGRVLSPAEQHRVWGWWALNAGHLDTARKHAKRALLRAPASPSAWRLFLCSLRGS